MAELQLGVEGADEPGDAYLADNRLTLDVHPNGAGTLSLLHERRKEEVERVEFLRLNCNEEQIDTALAIVPELRHLKSLVLKGGHFKDEYGVSQRGSLTTLPVAMGHLRDLTHLDLSFNSLVCLPECVTELRGLRALLVCRNLLTALPPAVGKLTRLTFLSLMTNRLRELPATLGDLIKLQRLDASDNQLEALPEELGSLGNCTELDFSGNRLETVPSSIGNLTCLKELHLHSNQLVTVPVSLASLPNLSRLDLQNNSLRSLPPEIQNLPFVHLKGNPLGDATCYVLSHVCLNCSASFSPSVFLSVCLNGFRFVVTVEGCTVVLPCGVELHFPPGAVTSTEISCRILSPDPRQVKLGHHDYLLSPILELQPHDIRFEKVWRMPFVPHRSRRKREVVIRTFSGTWSDLDTQVLKSQYMTCCRVLHFSWFLVVSRLKEDKCTVPLEGTRLLSSVDPDIKVTFPAGAVTVARNVKMRVLPVAAEDLHEFSDDQDSLASPLLCLSQNTADHFLKPVKIQLPLPTGVTRLNLDHSRLHLLHGDPGAQTWTDITSQVALEFTHLYVFFEVDHFSWYWLWYTTKECVGGIARKVYERLRKWHVNFVALQRKRDPEQVLLQCVPKNKVESVCKKLESRYRGPEPSDIVEMFEGEQFFAGFEKGIEVDSDRPDCVAGRIEFTFYSHLKNIKEIYVTTLTDRTTEAVKGQVSFYRGSLPETISEEAAKKRKGPDSQWLATLPIRLPRKSSLDKGLGSDISYPPLNLGDEETGYLTEANLLSIARRIGLEWRNIGINLGLSYSQLERIAYNNRDDLDKQILEMLFLWAHSNVSAQGCVQQLIAAMKENDREDIAEEIHSIIELGKRKYRESIRRVGLDRDSSNEDSAIAMV
uniref:P53-induced death domain protein 1 n=1 Tax=Callorhinchus milii TaxID=7868 RepID=A0A4W3HP20_CALMI